jgi:hypothetical protein
MASARTTACVAVSEPCCPSKLAELAAQPIDHVRRRLVPGRLRSEDRRRVNPGGCAIACVREAERASNGSWQATTRAGRRREAMGAVQEDRVEPLRVLDVLVIEREAEPRGPRRGHDLLAARPEQAVQQRDEVRGRGHRQTPTLGRRVARPS